jgi:hypothetical protein
MGYKEKDIVHESGEYWILDTGASYAVMKQGITHSETDSVYARDQDGLSIAFARCSYLANKDKS